MNKRAKIGLLVIVLVVLLVAGYLVLHRSPGNGSVANTTTALVREQTNEFFPSTLSIHPGTTVTWKNDTSEPFHIVSTPFPQHTDLPGLDSVQNVGPGGTYSYTFTQKGTFGFLDYMHPTVQGKVIVQ